MLELAKEMGVDVGFLDPQIFSTLGIQFQSNFVVDQIAKLMNHDFMVGAYNMGGHWGPVVFATKSNLIFHLDSTKIVPK